MTFLLLHVTVFGKTFAECSTEEEAIDWLRQTIADKQKMDKNIISIVFLTLIFSFPRLYSVPGGWWQNTLLLLPRSRKSTSLLPLLDLLPLSSPMQSILFLFSSYS